MRQPSNQDRGLEMKLLGSARFDRKQRDFVGFEVVVRGPLGRHVVQRPGQ